MHSLYPPTIGLIAMGQSAPIEHYIHLHLPEGVVAASTRVPYEEVSRPGMKRMIAHLPDAAALLSEAHPSVLIISNFIASCLMGQEMINILQQTVGLCELPAPARETAAGHSVQLRRGAQHRGAHLLRAQRHSGGGP